MCIPEEENTVRLLFDRAFQLYNNLGGVGPDNGAGDPDPTCSLVTHTLGNGRQEVRNVCTIQKRRPFADYLFPEGIRYVGVAYGQTDTKPDDFLNGYCGDWLADPNQNFLQTAFQWAPGRPRACDPYESIANYEAGDDFKNYLTSEFDVQYGNSELAAVAWGGRVFDAPMSADGRILNLGVLPGTNNSFVNGHGVGDPGDIPAPPYEFTSPEDQ